MDAYTYVKHDGMKAFKAFDIINVRFVDKMIYATILPVDDVNKWSLQVFADMNKHINLKVQLRVGNKIYFETK